ncbi:MAG: hypothetical protein M3O06_05930, partial [Pseudomonadota bacterium]|nr:hypothetical protein [Pseudomonadota bacterium]
SSAGSTATAAYTLYQPTATPTATAGKFTALYVIAGSTLEDFYTQGLEGDVIGRNGNTLIVQGSTLFLNNGSSSYNVANAEVLIGPNTLVTADDTTLSGLNYNSIAVGQHIIVRGIYSKPNNVVTLDASGAISVNTGSVRLVPTHLWGSLVSTGAGTLLMNLQNIDIWPVSDYNFAGNGTSPAADPKPTAFSVSTASLPIPPTTAGDPLWIDGLVAPFAAAPPDFLASSINNELGVQTAGGAAGASTCAPGTFSCIPASLRVAWSSPGTAAPFAALSAGGLSIDLANPNLVSSVIRIGPESIDLHALPASPQLVPTAAAAPVTANLGTPGAVTVTLPPVFLPAYSFGNPLVTGSSGIRVFSAFGTFATGLTTALASSPALQLEARGTFDRATNTFNAISVDVVL